MAEDKGFLETEGWSIWRDLLRLLGLVVAGLSLVPMFWALMFRFDSTDEYHGVLWLDLKLGFIFAMGLAILTYPPKSVRAQWRIVWLAAVFGVSAIVSGGLASQHYHQYLVRSSL